jgi:hypothetical protein
MHAVEHVVAERQYGEGSRHCLPVVLALPVNPHQHDERAERSINSGITFRYHFSPILPVDGALGLGQAALVWIVTAPAPVP